MPPRKDIWIIASILLIALILFIVSRLMPGPTLEGKTAEVTLAPDAIEYVDATEKPTAAPTPEVTEEPTAAPILEVTEEPTAAPTVEATEKPTTVPTQEATEKPTAAPTVEATEKPTTVPTQEATEKPTAAPTVEATEKPTATPTVEPTGSAPAENDGKASGTQTKEDTKSSVAGPAFGPSLAVSEEPVKGYVVVTVNGRQYGDPIPMDREKIITIRQDENTVNRIHITRDSVNMESSTCENQDCVGEGEITFDNYKTRILSTYIICLPNGVQVQMIPAEE